MSNPDDARPRPKLLLHVAAATVLLGAIVWFDPWIDSVLPASRLVLNLAPVIALYLLVYSVLRRALLSSVIILVPLALLHYINRVKLDELGQPFSIHDFGLTAQLIREVGLFARYSHGAILLVLVLLLAALCFALVRSERPARSGRWQAASLAAGLALGALLWSPFAERAYQRAGLYDLAWIAATKDRSNGLVAELVARSVRRVAVRPPSDPDALASALDRIRAQAQRRPSAPASELESPADVIVLLSESFFDPAALQGLGDCQALPAWCHLRSRGRIGTIRVPTYGGNTTRTEFEILTGVPYAALTKEVYPYNSLVTRPTESIAWSARRAGYATTAIHPHTKTFWNRHRALPALGFEHYIAEEDLAARPRRGFFITDTVLTDLIIERIEASSGPHFVLAISMENHGPWTMQRPGPGEAVLEDIPVPSALDPEAARSLRSFTYHARAALDDLGRLVRWMDRRDRPTLLLFFGDHLPALDEVFEQAGFDAPGSMYEQPLPYLLLSNRPALLAGGEPMPTHAHELGLWLFDRAGIPLETVQAALLELLRRPGLSDALGAERIRALHAELLHAEPQFGTEDDPEPDR